MGAMIARGPTLNRGVVDLLATCAEEEGIPFAFEVYTRTTATDADEIHLARAGVPTALVSIPTRYVHSPNELCALDDVDAIVRLLVAFAARLPRDASFVR
jgi:endoglucanase